MLVKGAPGVNAFRWMDFIMKYQDIISICYIYFKWIVICITWPTTVDLWNPVNCICIYYCNYKYHVSFILFCVIPTQGHHEDTNSVQYSLTHLPSWVSNVVSIMRNLEKNEYFIIIWYCIEVKHVEQQEFEAGKIQICLNSNNPDSKIHVTSMGPIWGQQDPDGPHVGPMNFAIWEGIPYFTLFGHLLVFLGQWLRDNRIILQYTIVMVVVALLDIKVRYFDCINGAAWCNMGGIFISCWAQWTMQICKLNGI